MCGCACTCVHACVRVSACVCGCVEGGGWAVSAPLHPRALQASLPFYATAEGTLGAMSAESGADMFLAMMAMDEITGVEELVVETNQQAEDVLALVDAWLWLHKDGGEDSEEGGEDEAGEDSEAGEPEQVCADKGLIQIRCDFSDKKAVPRAVTWLVLPAEVRVH